MIRQHFRFLIGATALVISTQAIAQDAPGRVLQKTNLRAFKVTPLGQPLVLGSVFRQLFTPTVVTCPGTGTCTFHIEVSSEIISLDAGAVAAMRVSVDDVVINSQPVAHNATNSTPTVQWIAIGITPGNHLVKSEMAVSTGTAFAYDRVQKINIYKP